MPKLPTVTPVKDLPPGEPEKSEMPEGFKIKLDSPKETSEKSEQPDGTPINESVPEETQLKVEMPSDYKKENCIIFNDAEIEIKPTKLKYFRNKSASGYGIIKAVPIHELFTYEKGVLDKDRDADQLVYDFLVAAFNDSTFVRDNYNELDAAILNDVVKIFGRINGIDEKEEAARKNREAQAQAKR